MELNATDVKIKKVSEEENVGVFSFEPLPQGYGHTLGNALRRVLLTSLNGAAVTQVRIEGVNHKFSTIPGVKEDVIELALNFKELRFKVFTENPVVGRINKKGAGKVTAKDIEISSEVEIVNKNQHIATLSDTKNNFEVELVVESGIGYSPIEERDTSKVGVILIDALFSPVVNASYKVEPTRLGGKVGLDRIVLTVHTDGTINPEDAITNAAGQLRRFFARFSEGEDEISEEVVTDENIVAERVVEDVSIDELPLPTRTVNALKKAGIDTLHNVAEMNDDDLADVKNLGEKSIEEIRKLLIKEGLRK